MTRGPRKEYAPLVVRCRECKEPHSSSMMTRKQGGWVCDKCVQHQLESIWEEKL